MSYCVSPECRQPQNADREQFCLNCHAPLVLKNRYRPIQSLGSGGFGRTFLAVDEDSPSRRRCVIKQLYIQSDDEFVLQKATELFRQEAVRLEELGEHPQIPNFLARFEENQQFYLIQELISGQTLQQELKNQGVFNEIQIWEFLKDLLPVLQYIHSHQVIHRDIKPANIIRRRRDLKPVLIDFGVAKLITGTALLHTGTTVGSPEYMAPEQNRGKALPASDLYSLGVTCIHLMTQVSPFDLFDINRDRWIWRDHLPSGAKVSDRLGKVLDKLLQNALSERYQSADEVLRIVATISSVPTIATPRQQSHPLPPHAVKTKLIQPSISKPSPPPANPPTPPKPPARSPNFLDNIWQQVVGKPTEGDRLLSVVGFDYSTLQELLARGKWQKADQETWDALCQIIGKRRGSYLPPTNIEKLPCEDLITIDQLWTKYSQGRFGFNIQTQIYASVNQEYEKFCIRVGWPTYQPFIPDGALKFNLRSPLGHLPSRNWVGGTEWWRHAESMANKLAQCSIDLNH